MPCHHPNPINPYPIPGGPIPDPKPDPSPRCFNADCRVTMDNLHEKFPVLTVRPRPEPVAARADDHKAWEKEHNQWGHLRCECGRGYFCREHGDWISGDEVGAGLALPGEAQKNGSCPAYHYKDNDDRLTYIGRRDGVC